MPRACASPGRGAAEAQGRGGRAEGRRRPVAGAVRCRGRARHPVGVMRGHATRGSTGAMPDPATLLRSRSYVQLLVIAALIGIPISALAYGFLKLVAVLQTELFDDLPGQLGLASTPAWWPVPIVALSGLLTALAIIRLPGIGGHSPADGFHASGPVLPIELPGIVLAALATLGFGAVLGPEAPLILIGSGLGVL